MKECTRLEECNTEKIFDRNSVRMKSVRLKECKIGRVKDWKSERLEECKIGRVQDISEDCEIGRYCENVSCFITVIVSLFQS